MSEIVEKGNERVGRFLNALDRMAAMLDRLSGSCQPRLGGECYLTDSEVSHLLKVSRRTLQEWRSNGQVAYIALGGKVLYRESDLQKLLDTHYHKEWPR